MKTLLIVLVLIFAVNAKASELEEYMKQENIVIPNRIQQRIDELNLIPMFGMTVPTTDCKEPYFLIEYCRKEDIQIIIEPQQIDALRDYTALRLKYYAKKRKYTVEYVFYRKIWGNVSYEPVWFRIDFSFL